ncbi:MAG TPA: hypothetical protein VMV19_11015 [Xanthobacteraceae bacterium]|nr:hypothetical protein [Xanthobacteraceae bacterium]
MQLTSDNIVTISAAILTVGGTIVGVIIANRMGHSRSYKTKIWDLRRPAYGLILSELGFIERICDNADEYIAEDQDRYFATVEQKDNAEIARHMAIIRKRFAEDYLILSSDFISLYGSLQKEMASDPYNSVPPEAHEAFSAAVRKFRPLLIALAKAEIAPR